MIVQPKGNFKLVNELDNTALNKNKVYNADIAYNQPLYKEKGLIFIDGLLLNKNDYIIIK